MEIRNLNTLLQVALTQNFTKAANILGYTQSNVSSQIRQLESDVGAPLFNRFGRKVTLTQYGQMLLPYAQQIVATSTHIENLLLDEHKLGGTIRIGFVNSIYECLFEDVFLSYHQKFPNVIVDITVDATTVLLKRVLKDELDAVFVLSDFYSNADMHYWNTHKCKIQLVASVNHPLASKSITLEDLNNQDFILMEDAAPYVINFKNYLAENSISIRSYLKVQSPEMVINVMKKTPCLSILADYSTKAALNSGDLVKLKLNDYSQSQTVQFVTHKNKAITPQLESFIQEVNEHFTSFIS